MTAPDLTGPGLKKALEVTGLSKIEFWREYVRKHGVSYNAFLGRVWRAEQIIPDRAHLFVNNILGEPWRLQGNYLIVGDLQVPTMNYEFFALMLAIAQKYLPEPRRLILAGDFINAEAFKTFDEDLEEQPFEREAEAAGVVIEEMLSFFEKILWFLGNHERRVQKRTRGAISPKLLRNLITHEHERVEVSHWGHCIVDTEHGPYRISHARNYSVNQGVVADQLAQKYQSHIIQHHEHHLMKGYDRYKRYVVVNNGGLFAPELMTYTVLDDSKMPNMIQGFSLLIDGHAEVFGPTPWTNWDKWL